MKNYIITMALALCALAMTQNCAAQASASTSTVYMELEGPDGVIQGEITQAGREGWHRIIAFNHEILSPRDAASGQATGKRQHSPFRIVKLLNRSTPLLLEAMTKNQVLPSVKIMVWTPSQTGVEVRMLTYTLKDASVASIRPWMPNKSDPATRDYAPAEEISFTYRTFEVTFHNGGVTAQDDWITSERAATP